MSYDTIKTKCLSIAKETNSFKDSYSAATLSFDSATKKILDSANGLAFLVKDDKIEITGSVSNNKPFTVITGAQAGYCVVSEAVITEPAGATVLISAPVHVKYGKYLMDSGIGNFLTFVPGEVGEPTVQARSSIRTWDLYGDLFIKFDGTEDEVWEEFSTVRSELIDRFEKYPMLNNSSGILKIRVSCPNRPEGVFDKSNNGPYWFTQEMKFSITERAALSGGDFS
jgi:hypothetical protein